MSELNVTLKRTPRALIVGDHTITIELACADSQVTAETHTPAVPDSKGPPIPHTVAADGSAVALRSPSEIRSSRPVSGGFGVPSASVASVVSDPSTMVLTPLAQSRAVPNLTEITTAEQQPPVSASPAVSDQQITSLREQLAQTSDLVAELQEQHRQSLAELQEVAVELSCAAASWLVGFAIERNMFAVDDLIRKALQQMEFDQPVRVLLHPADHELLKSLMNSPADRTLLTRLTCTENPTMPRGSCRVESGRRILVTEMNSRLEEIRRTWMENLDDAQTERRGDGTAARTLRRFPDRRETA